MLPLLLIVPVCCIAVAQTPPASPGVLVRFFDVGQDLRALPELVRGEKPNAVKVVPTIDLRQERDDFKPFENQFLTEVTGVLTIEQSGRYTFRLASDDGAKLWIDGRVVVDHDGAHPATPPKDGALELTAGPHELRVLHFQGGGDMQLTVTWRPPGAAEGQFAPLPPERLSHAAGAAPETAPGQKKVILPLRRGLPGDGSPVAGMHPGFAVDPQARTENAPPSLRPGRIGLIGEVLQPGVKPPIVWLPDEEGGGDPTQTRALEAAPYRGHQLILAGDTIWRVPLDVIDAENRQGCLLRFAQGQKVDLFHLVPQATAPFELRAVRAMTNGLEIEFTQPLDPRVGWEPESYLVEQWPFDPQTGAGPVRDGKATPVKSASVSSDRTKVFVEVPGLAANRVVYLRLLPPCVSEQGAKPWATEAWYALNTVPAERVGEILPPPPAAPQNVLTAEEQQAGWKLLFDGQTTQGWRGWKKDDFPDGWKVVGGALVRVGPGGDIATREQFDNFDLQLEWRIAAAGNSGIFYHAAESGEWPWETAPEMQVLDNAEHPDGREPKTAAGSNYALYAPVKDVTQPVGLWNQVRIVVHGNHVEHWLNGVKVVEYELGSPQWQQLVAASKFKDMPNYGKTKTGYIVLQDHGDKVAFRNIRIRALPAGGK
jgi:hypothetical protein